MDRGDGGTAAEQREHQDASGEQGASAASWAVGVGQQEGCIVSRAALDAALRLIATTRGCAGITAKAAEEGKPADIAEKIVEGQLKKYFAEKTLLEQPFIKNPDVTVGDLIKKRGDRKLVHIAPSATAEEAIQLMEATGISQLPVMDAGKVVGVVSIGDVVKDVIRKLEHDVGDLMGYIMRDGPGG